MNKFFTLRTGIFAGILALALLLRLPQFGDIPRGLNRDEAALGYNAYSLMQTGRDEHGKPWPLTFTSFGDQKLGGYIYSLLPFIQTFGLKSWVVRAPSLLVGILNITLVGVIAYQITSPWWKDKKSKVTGCIAAVLMSITPWANHFSRVAYEAHVALSFFLFGWLALQKSLDNKNQRLWLIGAGAAFSLSMMTYHSYQILVPLFILCSLLILGTKRILALDRIGLLTAIFIGVIGILGLVANGALSANQKKHAGISPYTSTAIQKQFSLMRLALPTPSLAGKFIANDFTEKALVFSKNIVSVMSPNFLFVNGTTQDVHNPGELANFHLLAFPFIVVGFFVLFSQKKGTIHRLFLAWIILALVPSALTSAPQHTIRASSLFPTLEVLAAIGGVSVFYSLSSKLAQKIFVATIFMLLTASVLRWRAEYFVLAPERDQAKSHEKYHLLARALQKEAQTHDLVYTQQPSSSPYIWYLFENGLDPQLVQTSLVHYPEDAEHFIHVEKMGNVVFTTIEWDDLKEKSRTQNLSLVFRPEEIPVEMRENSLLRHQETLHDHYGTAVYEIWHMGPNIQ